MNTCPYCGAGVFEYRYPQVYQCGSWRGGVRSYICKAREPLFQELQSTKERIEALVKVGDEIVENGSVSERLANEWNKAKGGAV